MGIRESAAAQEGGHHRNVEEEENWLKIKYSTYIYIYII
jgi:hypothetical protein